MAAASLLLMVACATTFPSSELAGPTCQANFETLMRVTYDKVTPSTYAIGCAGCPEVFIEAQYQWLQKHYPGYSHREQYTHRIPQSDGPDMVGNCFSFDAAEDNPVPLRLGCPFEGSHFVCFVDSGVCRERRWRS
jgi:hypothetical protein